MYLLPLCILDASVQFIWKSTSISITKIIYVKATTFVQFWMSAKNLLLLAKCTVHHQLLLIPNLKEEFIVLWDSNVCSKNFSGVNSVLRLWWQKNLNLKMYSKIKTINNFHQIYFTKTIQEFTQFNPLMYVFF